MPRYATLIATLCIHNNVAEACMHTCTLTNVMPHSHNCGLTLRLMLSAAVSIMHQAGAMQECPSPRQYQPGAEKLLEVPLSRASAIVTFLPLCAAVAALLYPLISRS